MAEKVRGCGFRKVGGLYLVGEGMPEPCDMLPLELRPCVTCGFEIPFNRGFLWLSKKWIQHYATDHHKQGREQCVCSPSCPICYPWNINLDRYGFMWVGSRDYTPKSFVTEARRMGVSKKIAKIPKGLVPGRTWVLLGHRNVPFQKKVSALKSEPIFKSAIFYAFVPKRVEKLIWQSQATESNLQELKAEGLIPVIIPDGNKDYQ